MREDVIAKVLNEKIIVIVRGVSGEKLIPLAEAMYNGGIRLMEVTYCADEGADDTAVADNISRLVREFDGRMLIGAGTVTKVSQVELTNRAGGGFIISPDTFSDVIKRTRELDMVSMPGAVTPTEIQTALRAGADFVKIFPATTLGPAYIKAVRAPLSNAKLLAVGGISLDNIGEYLKSGVCGFGLGANIVDKALLENNDYAGITELAKRYVFAVKQG